MTRKIAKGDKPIYVGPVTEIGTKEYPGLGCAYGSLSLKKQYKYIRVGSTVELYCRGLGSPVRGIVVDGHIVRYRTEKQMAEDQDRECARLDRQQRRNHRRAQAQIEAQYDALPAEFQRRMHRLRKSNPDDRHSWESYEMFILTEAVKLASALKTPEAVKLFMASDCATQHRMVPGISDGHSGNTHGKMCGLAYRHLMGDKI